MNQGWCWVQIEDDGTNTTKRVIRIMVVILACGEYRSMRIYLCTMCCYMACALYCSVVQTERTLTDVSVVVGHVSVVCICSKLTEDSNIACVCSLRVIITSVSILQSRRAYQCERQLQQQ